MVSSMGVEPIIAAFAGRNVSVTLTRHKPGIGFEPTTYLGIPLEPIQGNAALSRVGPYPATGMEPNARIELAQADYKAATLPLC